MQDEQVPELRSEEELREILKTPRRYTSQDVAKYFNNGYVLGVMQSIMKDSDGDRYIFGQILKATVPQDVMSYVEKTVLTRYPSVIEKMSRGLEQTLTETPSRKRRK